MNHRTTIKRNEILDTASQLFARHGYQGTNMKLLAKEAQASTSTIYSYFRDKTDLLSQSIERRLQALEKRHLARLQEIEDPVEALLQGIGLLNEAIAEDPLLASLMVYDAHVSDLRIRTHPAFDDDRIRTELERLEHRHRGPYTFDPRNIAGGRDHAAPTATNNDGFVPQLRIVALLDRRIEGVAVYMRNRQVEQFRMAQHTRATAFRASCPGIELVEAVTA